MSKVGNVLLCSLGLSGEFPCSCFELWVVTSHKRMNSIICRCCGELMPEAGNALSRNPNICASCSSMADGMDDSNASERVSLAPGSDLTPVEIEAFIRDQCEHLSAGLSAHRLPE